VRERKKEREKMRDRGSRLWLPLERDTKWHMDRENQSGRAEVLGLLSPWISG